jgi:hypothetical protein
MIGFISTLVTSSLNHTQLKRYRNSTHFQFIVSHALGFSVFTSRLLATDLKTETSTSNHHEVFWLFRFSHPVLLCPNLYTLHSRACTLNCWTNLSESRSQTSVTTDGQSASLSWSQAPIWGLQSDFYHCQTIAGLLWGAFSDERTVLPFTIAAGPR